MRVFTFLYYEYLNKEIQKDPEFTKRLHLFLLNLYLILLRAKIKVFSSPTNNNKNKISG